MFLSTQHITLITFFYNNNNITIIIFIPLLLKSSVVNGPSNPSPVIQKDESMPLFLHVSLIFLTYILSTMMLTLNYIEENHTVVFLQFFQCLNLFFVPCNTRKMFTRSVNTTIHGKCQLQSGNGFSSMLDLLRMLLTLPNHCLFRSQNNSKDYIKTVWH